MKMEATCSFETSTDFQQTTWRYIREDRVIPSLATLVDELVHLLNPGDLGVE
jgi:hypothetical protein